MKSLYQFQQILIPELMNKMDERYQILKGIAMSVSVGRRSLADYLKETERHIRSETEFLDRQGLIEVTNRGMLITSAGQEIVESYYRMVKESTDLTTLEHQLKSRLGLNQIKIVPGDADSSPETKQLLGKEAAIIFHEQIKDQSIVDVTGGSTMAMVANYMKPLEKSVHYLSLREVVLVICMNTKQTPFASRWHKKQTETIVCFMCPMKWDLI